VEYVFLVVIASMALLLKARKMARALITNNVISFAVLLSSVAVAAIFADQVIWVAASLALGAAVGVVAMTTSSVQALKTEAPRVEKS
jgi:hypothetical protein